MSCSHFPDPSAFDLFTCLLPATMIIGFVLTVIIVTICIRFFDKMLAVYISRLSFNGKLWHRLTADIPDTLFLAVCIITVFALVCYLTRKNKGIFDKVTKLSHLVMYAVPASFIVKSLCKYVFGRINTREWLIRPESYGFHWFHGGGAYGGFPSGHMAVFTALTAALWRFYPRQRSILLLLPLFLAVALVVTNYHFLSDVIAGAYLGVIVEIYANKLLRDSEKTNTPF